MSATPASFYRDLLALRKAIAQRDPRILALFQRYATRGIVDTLRMALTMPKRKRRKNVIYIEKSRGVIPPASEYDAITEDKENWITLWKTVKAKNRTGKEHMITKHNISIHRKTGLKVMFRDRSILLEIAVPRGFGAPTNEFVEYRSLEELLTIIHDITIGLFPESTALAEKRGAHWRCTRLDLAIDLSLRMKDRVLFDLLADLKWKRTREEAETYNNDRPRITGCSWGRSNDSNPTSKLSIYYKFIKIMQAIAKYKSQSARDNAHLPIPLMWRLEVQSRGAQTLTRIAKLFPTGNDLIIGLKKKNQVSIKLDYPSMHALLFLSLLELTPVDMTSVIAHQLHLELLEHAYPGMLDRA